MTECIVKQYGCSCHSGECSVQRQSSPAPVILPSLRTQAITCLFLGAVMTFVSAAVMEGKMKHQDQINQENVNVTSR